MILDHTPIAQKALWTPVVVLLLLLELLWTNGWTIPWFQALNSAASILPDRFWSMLTVYGDILVLFALMLPLAKRDPETLRAIVISLLLVTLVLQGLKHFHNFPRPAVFFTDPATYNNIGPRYLSRAFPSGHTTTAAVFFSVLLLRWPAGGCQWLRLSLLSILLLTAFSRIAVGIHWPTDVLAGLMLGWIAAMAGVSVAQNTRWLAATWVRGIVIFLSLVAVLSLLNGFDGGYPLASPMLKLLAFSLLFWTLWDWRTELTPLLNWITMRPASRCGPIAAHQSKKRSGSVE